MQITELGVANDSQQCEKRTRNQDAELVSRGGGCRRPRCILHTLD